MQQLPTDKQAKQMNWRGKGTTVEAEGKTRLLQLGLKSDPAKHFHNIEGTQLVFEVRIVNYWGQKQTLAITQNNYSWKHINSASNWNTISVFAETDLYSISCLSPKTNPQTNQNGIICPT